VTLVQVNALLKVVVDDCGSGRRSVASLGLTRLIASVLFGIKSWDPVVFVTVPMILVAVALLAVWLPATRASGLDPIEALRVE
jgi:ABC-type lipoprotein release transport system permease subunit